MAEDKEQAAFNGNVRELLKTSFGKAVLWAILEEAGLYTPTFTGNSQTYYLEGKRDMGLFVLEMIQDADPTAYARLLLDKQKLEEAKS